MKKLVLKLSLKNIIATIFISLLFAGVGASFINRIADSMMPEREITITVEPSERNEVWIFDDGAQNTLFSALMEGEKKGEWEYRDAETFGYAGNMLYAYGDTAGNSVTFSAPIRQQSYISFWRNINSSKATIYSQKDYISVDLYSDVEGGDIIRVYPFQNELLPVIVRLVLYALLSVLIFVLLMAVRIWINTHLETAAYTHKKRTFFLFWIILYAVAVIQYKLGIPNFLSFGDQSYYWVLSPFEYTEYIASSYSFRGYLCHIFPVISQMVGARLHIDPAYVHFLSTSAAISWLFTYVLPSFYEDFTGKKAVVFSMVSSLIIYLFFWNGTLTAVLVDLFGAVAFCSGVLFSRRFWKQRSLSAAVLMGFFFSVACNLRTAYQYAIYVLLCYAVVQTVRQIPLRKIALSWKSICGGALALIMFILVALPQFQVNATKGHIGLLPYDYPGAWIIDENPVRQNTLAEWSATYSTTDGYSGYPFVVSDDQMLSMKTEMYHNEDLLTIPQILGWYANSPVESIVYLVKKFFVAFDPKTSVSYPDKNPWREGSGILFSLLNYLVLGSAFYVIFVHKEIQKSERLLCGLFFMGLVAPQMLVHVEWRYFLSTYILLYYFFSYHFLGKLVVEKENCKELLAKGYLPYLCAVLLIAITISFTLHA